MKPEQEMDTVQVKLQKGYGLTNVLVFSIDAQIVTDVLCRRRRGLHEVRE